MKKSILVDSSEACAVCKASDVCEAPKRSKEPVPFNNKYHQLVFVINSSEHKTSTVLIPFSGKNTAYLYINLQVKF